MDPRVPAPTQLEREMQEAEESGETVEGVPFEDAEFDLNEGMGNNDFDYAGGD